MMFGSFRDCGSTRALFADISFEKSGCCRIWNYNSQAWNEKLRWLLCARSCNQVFVLV